MIPADQHLDGVPAVYQVTMNGRAVTMMIVFSIMTSENLSAFKQS